MEVEKSSKRQDLCFISALFTPYFLGILAQGGFYKKISWNF